MATGEGWTRYASSLQPVAFPVSAWAPHSLSLSLYPSLIYVWAKSSEEWLRFERKIPKAANSTNFLPTLLTSGQKHQQDGDGAEAQPRPTRPLVDLSPAGQGDPPEQ